MPSGHLVCGPLFAGLMGVRRNARAEFGLGRGCKQQVVVAVKIQNNKVNLHRHFYI